MGTDSKVDWTTHSWNPWQGCHKVSAACLNCYMYRDKKRYGQDPAVVVRSRPATFRKPLAKDQAGRWKWGDGSKVFTCSWSDFFIKDADSWRVEAWEVIRQRPGLVFQILTKRPERIWFSLPDGWGYTPRGWRNVWIGITAENQDLLDKRMEKMTEFPAFKRFISIEPMLGPVNLRPWFLLRIAKGVRLVDWVIVGCESGPNRRETKIEWVEEVRDQCVEAGVPLFVKQIDVDGQIVHQPEIGGRQWLEFPA